MRWLSIVCIVFVVWSCQQSTSKSPEVEIKELEEKIKSDAELDTAIAFDLTDLYLEYASNNPKDSISPYYLSRAADIYKELPGKGLKAINLYNRIINEHSEHPLAPRSVFMIGYVFDENLDDKKRARKTYRHFLASYPDHELAGQAQDLLKLLETDLSEEELVAKWLEEAKKDTNQKSKE